MANKSFFTRERVRNKYILALVASEYYERKTEKGILTIRPKKYSPGNWELRLYVEGSEDGIVIRSDYIDPREAAFDASRHDFGIAEIEEMFQNVYVPSELQFWRTFQSVYQTNSSL